MKDASPDAPALPSSRSLLRTTLLALAVAGAIVVGAVLPAEYGVDPTGIGRVLGLTQMGMLKQVLMKEEAESLRQDSLTVTLAPAAHVAVKLVMTEGQIASYRWTVDSGAVSFDMRGDGPASAGSPSARYGQGTLHSAEGEIAATFTGLHGWYWENKTDHVLSVSIKAWGSFQALEKQ